MTLKEAFDYLHEFHRGTDICCAEEMLAWQTLKNFVLAQQTNNSDYMAAQRVFEEYQRTKQSLPHPLNLALSYTKWFKQRLHALKAEHVI